MYVTVTSGVSCVVGSFEVKFRGKQEWGLWAGIAPIEVQGRPGVESLVWGLTGKSHSSRKYSAILSAKTNDKICSCMLILMITQL